MINLGNRIKTLRLEKNINQKQLAAQLGVSASAIPAYEQGIRNPSLTVLIKLAHVFGVSTDYLLGLDKIHSVSVENLTEEQIKAISLTVECFEKGNKKQNKSKTIS